MRCSDLRPREIARRLPTLETGDDRKHGWIAQGAQDRKIIGRRIIEMIDLAAPLGPPDGEEIVQAEQLGRPWASRPRARIEIEPRSAEFALQRGDLLVHGVGPGNRRLGRGEEIKDRPSRLACRAGGDGRVGDEGIVLIAEPVGRGVGERKQEGTRLAEFFLRDRPTRFEQADLRPEREIFACALPG